MSIITFPLQESRPAHPHLRRFDVRTDLRAVADLVERCFSETLDADGRRYIQNMRRTADSPQFFRWAAGLGEKAGVSYSGFVWERDGAIVGNLSLIPMHSRREKIFLIANVAVDPDHRRQGIARSLTEAALEESTYRRADRLWLHVREDNPAAIRLYESMGFAAHVRRTTWYDTARADHPPEAAGIRIGALPRRFWMQAKSWFHRDHPPDLDWYLSLDLHRMDPGLQGWFIRLLNGAGPRCWTAARDGRLLAVLARQGTRAAADRLWLAAPEDADPRAIRLLLHHAENEQAGRKPLNLEYPAGRAVDVLQEAGFSPHQTLIWMYRNAEGRPSA